MENELRAIFNNLVLLLNPILQTSQTTGYNDCNIFTLEFPEEVTTQGVRRFLSNLLGYSLSQRKKCTNEELKECMLFNKKGLIKRE